MRFDNIVTYCVGNMRVLIVFFLFGAALGSPRVHHRFMDSTTTTVEQYPFMSSMQYRLYGLWWYQSCGGSLLTSTVVLSAAHCYEGDQPSEWQVRLGTSLASSEGSVHAVYSFALHDQFTAATLDYDVAIVRLTTNAVFSDSIGVASIAGPNYNLPDGTFVEALGWPIYSASGYLTERLQKYDINLVNQDICAERWQSITERMLCAGRLGMAVRKGCQGDSGGGPLVHNGNVVIGVLSWGYDCAPQSHEFGVSARVSSFTEWILENAA